MLAEEGRRNGLRLLERPSQCAGIAGGCMPLGCMCSAGRGAIKGGRAAMHTGRWAGHGLATVGDGTVGGVNATKARRDGGRGMADELATQGGIHHTRKTFC